MKVNTLRNINSIVDASRFDLSNPTDELPGPGLINQATTIELRKDLLLMNERFLPGFPLLPIEIIIKVLYNEYLKAKAF
jgi:hypothetical protein